MHDHQIQYTKDTFFAPYNKNVDIKFIALGAFLEWLKMEGLKSQIILKWLGAIK
jgi:hypothetical protein